jgi:hypothetical protein
MLVVVWVRPVARAIHHVAAAWRTDRPTAVLRLAARWLPSDRAAWGEAMLAELDESADPRGRWRFALGCLRAAAAIRLRATLVADTRGGNPMRVVLLGTVAAAAVLTAYGMVRYPGLGVSADAGPTGAALAAALVIDAVLLFTLLRGTAPQAGRARRLGAIAGVVAGLAWLAVLSPGPLKSWVLVPLLIALACPAVVAAVTARGAGGAAAPTAAAVWTGIVGGLVVFVGWAATTYLRAGRPYDAQLIRDFRHSGAHDLATYAIAGNLESAVGLLAAIPIVCLALGSVARLATTGDLGRTLDAHRDAPRR